MRVGGSRDRAHGSAPPVTALAPHLSWAEVLRRSGWDALDDVPPSPRASMIATAREVWTPLRRAWAGPLTVVSGLRSPRANRAADGARRSQHMDGMALDLRPEDPAFCGDLYDLALLLMGRGEIPRGWLCLYRYADSALRPGRLRFVHIDRRGFRPTGGLHIDGRRTSLRRDRLYA